MACRQKDSDDNIGTITIEPPLLENEEKSRNRHSRTIRYQRKKNIKKEQPQGQSTSTDQKVLVQEYPTSSKDKSEVSGNPSQQQMFDPKIFIVSGLSDTTAHKDLFGYLKYVTFGDLKKLTLLGEGKAVAEVGKDISGFQKLKNKIRSRKMEGMQLKINRVHACDSILVSGLPPGVTKDTILLYFESIGGDVSDVSLCEYKDSIYSAVVTFVNPEVVANVVQITHVLETQKLTVKKYFPQIDANNINARSCAVSLQKEETEKEESSAQHHVQPVQRLRTSVKVDDDIMKFIKNGVYFQELEGELDELYAEIEWNSGSNRVTIWMKADPIYIKSWVIRCKTVFAKFLDRFHKSSLSLEESIKNAVSVALPRLAEMVSAKRALWKVDEEKQELVVVCLEEETVTVLQSGRKFVEMIKKEEIRKTFSKEKVKDINHGSLVFLKHIRFVEKIQEKWTELAVTLDLENHELYFEGPRLQFLDAKVTYLETMEKISEKIVNVQSYIASMISTEPGKRYIDEELVQQNISAVLLPESDSAIRIVAATSQECDGARKCLFDSIREVKLPFPSGHDFMFEKEKWKQISEKLKSQQLIHLSIDHKTDSVVLQGATYIVEKSEKEITEYIEEIGKMFRKKTIRDISHDRLLFLKHTGFVEKMKERNSEMEVTLDLEKRELYFEGPQRQYIQVMLTYIETMEKISEKVVDLPSYIASMISTEPGKKYIDEQLVQQNISAVLLPESVNAIKIVAATSQECDGARKCLFDSIREVKVQFRLGHDFMFEKEKQISEKLDHQTDPVVLQATINIGGKSEKESQALIKSQKVKERVLKVSNGVARFLKEKLSSEINGIEARLKSDKVTIELCPSVISCRGIESGLDVCEKSISELRQMVIEKKKNLCSPGLNKLLLSETGQPYLRVIEIKNDVVIEMTSERREGVKETSETEVKSLRDELEKEKRKRSALADDRSRFTTETETVESTYDLCNFTTIEGLRVSWIYGNIAHETADILVNSAQSNLSNPTACGKALNKVGGPSFIQACKQESIGKGGVVLTSGGNLSCKYVLHAVCCSWDSYQGRAEELLHNLVREILRKCKQCRATSLAMPAIGTGNHMFPEDVVFRIFREEFEIFSSSHSTFTMKDIRIVVFAKQVQLTTQPTQVHGKKTTPAVFSWLSSVFTRLTSSQPTIAKVPSQSSESTPITRFTPLNTGEPKQAVNLQVFAISNQHIDASFDEVDTFVKNQTTTKEIENEKVFEVFLKHWSKIQNLARHHDVRITCQKSSIALIEGSVTDVSDCKDKLMQLVEEERKVNQLKYISKNVQWHYLQGSRAVEYNSELNGLIETASMENKQFLEITKFGQQYEIDLIRMMEKNKKTGSTEKITRKLLRENSSDISLPPNWDPQGKSVHLVSLARSSSEYQKVLNHFDSKGGSGSRVSTIQRIQNPRLYMSFVAAKKAMKEADNEMQLFHGTSASNTKSINANNFSRNFSGVNGVMYGDGVYFARDSSYSLRYSQSHGNSGNSKMYVARVLVGRYTTGGKGMKAPPSRNDPSNPGVWYDSVVDNVLCPSIFVIFVDNHYYPEYLITFAGANQYSS